MDASAGEGAGAGGYKKGGKKGGAAAAAAVTSSGGLPVIHGIIGPLLDLVKPTHPRYNTAVDVVRG